MTGDVAPLDRVCNLAEAHDAGVLVDDCQATGVVGPTGRGTAEACGVQGRVDLISSTLGKAVCGANGALPQARLLHPTAAAVCLLEWAPARRASGAAHWSVSRRATWHGQLITDPHRF